MKRLSLFLLRELFLWLVVMDVWILLTLPPNEDLVIIAQKLGVWVLHSLTLTFMQDLYRKGSQGPISAYIKAFPTRCQRVVSMTVTKGVLLLPTGFVWVCLTLIGWGVGQTLAGPIGWIFLSLPLGYYLLQAPLVLPLEETGYVHTAFDWVPEVMYLAREHRGKLSLLRLRTLGWWVLGYLCLGLGIFYTGPKALRYQDHIVKDIV